MGGFTRGAFRGGLFLLPLLTRPTALPQRNALRNSLQLSNREKFKKKLTSFFGDVVEDRCVKCWQVNKHQTLDKAEVGVLSMKARVAVLCVFCLVASSAIAEELRPEQAKAFVVGKVFAYSCFDGTAGMGRIMADGSIAGTIAPGGRGETKFASLPPGTIKVSGNSVCAHILGLPIEPCFRVQRIDQQSFRGSIAGSDYAYCDFYQGNPETRLERPLLMHGLY
jgi:hypothetical protein